MKLSVRERRLARAAADAIIPPGRFLPGADDEATVSRFETVAESLGAPAFRGLQALLHGLDVYARARHLRPFHRLGREARTRVLERWQTTLPGRLAIRGLVLPLKMAHFNDPALFETIGCAWKPEPATAERTRWRSQLVPGADVAAQTLEADVVVVGTGAGGAVVAYELARRGHAVLMLEEGPYWDRSDFSRTDRVTTSRELYRGGGLVPCVGNGVIALMAGSSVGGSTTINSGTCFRTPDSVLRGWQDEIGLRDLGPDEMAPRFERVERIIGVEEARWEHLGGVAEVIRDGCDLLGYSHHPLRRNAPGCDGQGVCCFGCPTDAKRSTNVSYVPMALQSGATCITSARVDRIQVEGGRAVGLEAVVGHGQRVSVRAAHVVLACGSLHTPMLLLRNRLANRSGQVGRNLSIHPAFGLHGLFDRVIAGWRGIPQGYCIDEFKDEGLMFEGASVPFEMATMAFPQIGQPFVDIMEAFERVATFGFMISDTSRGRVRPGLGGQPLVTYVLNGRDTATVQRGAELLGRVMFAAGARSVYAPIHRFETLRGPADLARLRTARLAASDFELSAYHPLGTCRLGVDPRQSVTDPDHETHDIGRLYVVDGSSVPTALGVNPQVTIMAMATRFAERLHERLS